MTDYRTELQRLVQAYDEHGGKWHDEDVQALHRAVEAARTALAQPELGGSTDEDIQRIALSLPATCDWSPEHTHWTKSWNVSLTGLLIFARAILARYARPALAQPEPEGVTDEELLRCYGLAKRDHCYEPPPAAGEVAELVKWLMGHAAHADQALGSPIDAAMFTRAAELVKRQQPQAVPAAAEVAELVAALRDPCIAPLLRERTRAADLLERQYPQPVPVSERLPGAEDCDAEGFCWFFSPADPAAGLFGVAACWVLRKFEPEDDFRTHWLPAHTLPLPTP